MSDQDEIQQDSAELLSYMGTDAERWTEQFLTHTDLANAGPDFVSTVQSWFANAIETGRSAGYSGVLEEIKHNMHNLGFEDTSEIYTPAQAVEVAYKEVPSDHQCL